MEVIQRKSDRVRNKKSISTPGKLVSRGNRSKNKTYNALSSENTRTVHTDYNLNKKKAVSNKLEAADRTFTVAPEIKGGNLVLIFSAAAYLEFRSVTESVLTSAGLNLENTQTKDKTGALIYESIEVRTNDKKLFVLNFYNTTSKVLLNGNEGQVILFIRNMLSDILCILDRNDNFKNVNYQIREYCKIFINKIDTRSDSCQNTDPQLNQINSKSSTCIDNSLSCSNNSFQIQTAPIKTKMSKIETINLEWKCPICTLECDSNSEAAQCDLCSKWLHYECEELAQERIDEIEGSIDSEYICRSCSSLRELASDSNSNDNQYSNSQNEILPKYISTEKVSEDTSVKTPEYAPTSQQHCKPQVSPIDIDDNPNETTKITNIEKSECSQSKVKCSVKQQSRNIVKPKQDQVANTETNNHKNDNTLGVDTSVMDSPQITREEIKYLKAQLNQKDKIIKQKDCLILKLQSEILGAKNELSTSRAYSIKLEQEVQELECSIKIQKQTQSSRKQPVESNENDNNMKSWYLEQRVKQLEFEVVRQDNKISNLSDKFLDLKIESRTVQSRRSNRTNRVQRNFKRNEARNDQNTYEYCDQNIHNNECMSLYNSFSDMNMEFRCDESEEKQAHDEEHKLNGNNTCNSNNFLCEGPPNRGKRGITNNTNLSRKRSYERQDFPHIPTKRKMDNLPPRFQRQRQVAQQNYNPTRQNTMNAFYPEQQMNTMRRTSQTWQGQPAVHTTPVQSM